MDKIKEFSWTDVDRLTRQLSEYIKIKKIMPDCIVGIIRGGCIPAIHLSHLLDIQSIQMVNLHTTITNEVRSPRVNPIIEGGLITDNFRGKRIVLVDDVTNTGTTLKTARDYLLQLHASSVCTCALVWDTVRISGNGYYDNTIADYYGYKVDAWAVFPWEH